MLEEFENICIRLSEAIENQTNTKEIIEKRALHVRSFMLKCDVDVEKIHAIESKYNL